ncbi:MAG: hypothetical protein H6730_15045 [Deltaproteobacteria bacterium]|nr:hypothetical protein [Deltaproteobacteria bacterium]
MSEEHLWVVLYSAPEDGPKSTTTAPSAVRWGRPHLPRALRCANRIAPSERVLVAVLEQEEPWWSSVTGDLPRENLAQQPLDRGSGVGLLVTLLEVAQRDPEAEVVLFTSDEVCVDAAELAARGRAQLALQPDRIHLVGRAPRPEDNGGSVWVVPGGHARGDVAGLVFGPTRATRSYLVEQGATVATPVVVGHVGRFLELFRRVAPGLIGQLEDSVLAQTGVDADALHEVYPFLDVLDFHRDVLARSPAALAVSAVAAPPRVVPAPVDAAPRLAL